MCSSKPICAVLKTRMCSQTKKNSKQSSHVLLPLWMLQKIPEMLSLTEHKKSTRSQGEDSRPSYFPHKSLTCWGNGKEGKIGASDAPQKRLKWENLIFFAASNANLRLLYIECP